jgi:hypothetical protein
MHNPEETDSSVTHSADENSVIDLSSDDDQGAHNPVMLAELTRAALPYLGPFSITTVKRVSRETESAKELVKGIATHIEDLDKRQHFLRQGKRIVRAHIPKEEREVAPMMTTVTNVSRSSSTKPETIEAAAKTPQSISPEQVQRGELALARIIGPLAVVLVARYTGLGSVREFHERLASHLRTPEERDQFYLDVRSGG